MTSSTEDLISKLALDMKPTSPTDSVLKFFAKWTLAGSFAIALWLLILPIRPDLGVKQKDLFFYFFTFLWLALSASSTYVVYNARIPGLQSPRAKVLSLTLAASIILACSIHGYSGDLTDEFFSELNLSRGMCGPLIFALSVSWGAGLIWWTRKGATTFPASTGRWAALSAASLAGFAMQLICDHENSLHLLIWHIVPVAALVALGSGVGRRFLKW